MVRTSASKASAPEKSTVPTEPLHGGLSPRRMDIVLTVIGVSALMTTRAARVARVAMRSRTPVGALGVEKFGASCVDAGETRPLPSATHAMSLTPRNPTTDPLTGLSVTWVADCEVPWPFSSARMAWAIDSWYCPVPNCESRATAPRVPIANE